LIVDLAQDNSGAWAGSIIMPGLGVKGAALTEIALKDSELLFAIKRALGAQRASPVDEPHIAKEVLRIGVISLIPACIACDFILRGSDNALAFMDCTRV
jgi:hypothetical protein